MHGRGRYWAAACAITIAAVALTACGGEDIDEAALSVPQAPQTIATEQGPRALAFDGTHLWVTLYGVQTVAKYTLDGENVGNYKAGAFPRALAFDGTHMWVGNSSENTITKMALDGEALQTVSIGTPDTSPSALAFDGASIWVAASWGNSVSKVNLDGSVVKTVRVPGYHPSLGRSLMTAVRFGWRAWAAIWWTDWTERAS